ncbi:MAG: FG-GAP-like repeat-containing protein, partial [Candidatus Zixiibacteriota bacterium]
HDSVMILLNDGLGNFTRSTAQFIDTSSLQIPPSSAAADLDGDCNLDFVVATTDVRSTGESIVTIGLGDGSGSLISLDTIMVGGVVHQLNLSDVNRDKTLDLVIGNGSAHQLEILLGDGLGNFSPPDTVMLTGLPSTTALSLSMADLNRDGNPDFISGNPDSGYILLAFSQLDSANVLVDEMVVTGFSNIELTVINPLGFVISSDVTTVAGGSIWRLDVNGNDTLDQQTVDNNLQYGEYTIICQLRPEHQNDPDPRMSMGIRINGSQQLDPLINYPVGSKKSASAAGCGGDSVVIYFTVEEESSVTPANGVQTNGQLPVFRWHQLVDTSLYTNYHFQLDAYIDFRAPRFDDSGLTFPRFDLPDSLAVDSVYYWRFRSYDGISWSPYSHPLAAYIGAGCCAGMRGDVNGDGSDLDIVDLTCVVDFLFGSGCVQPCQEEADINGDGATSDIVDLTMIVDWLFGTPPILVECM